MTGVRDDDARQTRRAGGILHSACLPSCLSSDPEIEKADQQVTRGTSCRPPLHLLFLCMLLSVQIESKGNEDA